MRMNQIGILPRWSRGAYALCLGALLGAGIFLFLASTAMAGAGPGIPSPVRLVYANPFYYGANGQTWSYTDIHVHVKKTAAAPGVVTVYYTTSYGKDWATWVPLKLDFIGDYGDHYLYTAHYPKTVFISTLSYYISYKDSYGRVYYDGSATRPYQTEPCFTPFIQNYAHGVVGQHIGLLEAKITSPLNRYLAAVSGLVAVGPTSKADYLPQRSVEAVLCDAQGFEVASTFCSRQYKMDTGSAGVNPCGDVEVCSFSFPDFYKLVGGRQDVYLWFAIYDVDGNYLGIDDNFGQMYKVPAGLTGTIQ